MRVLLSTCGSRGDVGPMVGLAVQLRALGAEVTVCAPPAFAEPLAHIGVALVPVGQPVRPLVTRATPPSAADLPRPGPRASWSPRRSKRSPQRPRDVMRWWRPA
jgi:vancomycin aglycone glucosyltransferase